MGKLAVSGEVTVDGQALGSGAISLDPAPGGPSMSAGARIRAGRFDIPPAQGLVPGVYRVRIFSASREQAAPPPGGTERTRRPMLERIPADYNVRSNRTVEIRKDQSNHLKFEIVTTASEGSSEAIGKTKNLRP